MALEDARILIVDDQPANVFTLKEILSLGGYRNIETVSDPTQVLAHFLQFLPDVILLDLHMPRLDGIGVMKQLRPWIADDTYLPILMLTADASPEAKERALSAGANDFLTKPFDTTEVFLRLKNLLETRLLHLQLERQKAGLEERVEQRTSDLELARREILERLAVAAEYRDDDTGQHTKRVGKMAGLLARTLGLEPTEIGLIERAAPLHDVGKIGIPDSILLKPAGLTDEEFARMKSHTIVGAQILSGSRVRLLQRAKEIALTHHEKWDGSGYAGLSKDSIPISGRITAVADVFDALTHDRPYKKAWSVEDAIGEIRSQSGSHFDPSVVDAFIDLADEGLLATGATVVRLAPNPDEAHSTVA